MLYNYSFRLNDFENMVLVKKISLRVEQYVLRDVKIWQSCKLYVIINIDGGKKNKLNPIP